MPYVWDFYINVKMAGKIKNIKSINHKVQFNLDSSDESRGTISLDESEKFGLNGYDLVISIGDECINIPTAIAH